MHLGAGVGVARQHLAVHRAAQDELLAHAVGATGAEQARLLRRTLVLGLGAAEVVLRGFQIPARPGLQGEHLALA